MSKHIKVSDSRHKQLKTIAKKEKKILEGLVDQLLEVALKIKNQNG